MAEGSFMGNGCLAVILPEGLTTIPSKAFDHCLNLLYVYVPDSVKKIEGGAFARCFNLLEVSLPKGVTIIPCIHEHYQEYEWRPYDEDIDRDYSYDYNTFENNSCLKYREHSLSAEEWLARITGK